MSTSCSSLDGDAFIFSNSSSPESTGLSDADGRVLGYLYSSSPESTGLSDADGRVLGYLYFSFSFFNFVAILLCSFLVSAI